MGIPKHKHPSSRTIGDNSASAQRTLAQMLTRDRMLTWKTLRCHCV